MIPALRPGTSALCLLLAFLLLACPLLAQTVQSYRTTSDLSVRIEAQPSLAFRPGAPASPEISVPGPVPGPVAGPAPSSTPTIDIDETQRYQTIDGFGASMTDGSAWLLQDRLPSAGRSKVMAQLFDPVNGIGLTFLRQPIASSDLSRNHYSFDDMPAGQRDPRLRHFSTSHDDPYVFPVLREALQLNPAITVVATPWSPPAWMKTHDSMNGGRLRDDAMSVYAQYLVRSLQAFASAGVPVKYLTVQNEPLNETRDYPGTLMPASQAAQFIGVHLGPALKQAGLNTEILAYDHNWDHPEYPIEVLSDPAAAPSVAGSALHCYGGRPAAQDAIHEKFPGKGIWLTECSGGTWQTESPLLATAHLLIETTRHWSKSVSLWTMVLDTEHNPHAGGCGTCRGLVTLDLHKSPVAISYNGDFYALGHASRFVHPGATRIASASPGRDSLETVAFQNIDGSIVLLALNNRRTLSDFTIRWHGRVLQTSLSPETLATYIWPGTN